MTDTKKEQNHSICEIIAESSNNLKIELVKKLGNHDGNEIIMPKDRQIPSDFYRKGDSIRGMALDAGFPLVMVVGYRGWTRKGNTPDTAATYTEPFLNAFRINYYLVEHDADGPRISEAFEEARKTKRPVVVLIGDEYHGFNR